MTKSHIQYTWILLPEIIKIVGQEAIKQENRLKKRIILQIILAAIIHDGTTVFQFLNENDKQNSIYHQMIDLTTGKIGCLYEWKLICLAYTHILELDVIPDYLWENVDKILQIVVS